MACDPAACVQVEAAGHVGGQPGVLEDLHDPPCPDDVHVGELLREMGLHRFFLGIHHEHRMVADHFHGHRAGEIRLQALRQPGPVEVFVVMGQRELDLLAVRRIAIHREPGRVGPRLVISMSIGANISPRRGWSCADLR
jgi:hypothetical protein